MRFLFVSCLLFVLGIETNTSVACTQPDIITPLSVTITRTDDFNATMVAEGYSTFGSTIPPTVFCVCGYGTHAVIDSCSIQSLNTFEIRDHVTQLPLAGFDFAANGITTTSLTNDQGGLWSGFSSEVAEIIAPGELVDLIWTINTAPCDDAAIAATVLDNGMFATDEGDATGVPLGTHQHIRKPVSVVVRRGTGTTPSPRNLAELEQNNPNPFNPSTNISFSLTIASSVQLFVYDARGKVVRRLLDESRPSGRQSVGFDGRGDSGERLPSGVYYYELTIGASSQGKKMLLVQ